MAKVLVVTSGKGGVGKTTTTAAIGAALAQSGQSVAVVDFDVGLRNLDLVLGAERRVVFDLINVVQGVAKLSQALIRDKRLETLWLLPASQTRDKDALTDHGVASVIKEMRGRFDWVICDSPAGIERGAQLAMRFADAALIVTNPEVSSVRDSDRIIGLLDSKTEKAEKGQRIEKHILITRYDPQRAARGEMISIEDVLDILSTPLLGIIPESEEVLRASNVGSPVTLSNPASAPARAYLDAARRLKGSQGAVRQAVRTESGMSFFNLFRRRRTAPVARERLQILLSYERASRGQADLLGVLREEILAAIAKHVKVERDHVQVRVERGQAVSTLEIDVAIQHSSGMLLAAGS
jgi:septum site-determining protein MinD